MGSRNCAARNGSGGQRIYALTRSRSQSNCAVRWLIRTLLAPVSRDMLNVHLGAKATHRRGNVGGHVGIQQQLGLQTRRKE